MMPASAKGTRIARATSAATIAALLSLTTGCGADETFTAEEFVGPRSRQRR
jgi:hypothetical protein